ASNSRKATQHRAAVSASIRSAGVGSVPARSAALLFNSRRRVSFLAGLPCFPAVQLISWVATKLSISRSQMCLFTMSQDMPSSPFTPMVLMIPCLCQSIVSQGSCLAGEFVEFLLQAVTFPALLALVPALIVPLFSLQTLPGLDQ